jgi:2-polyprenyl-3-methyl-5-hydroxy-6-metoxy-1,4-benzoquinol methylase
MSEIAGARGWFEPFFRSDGYLAFHHAYVAEAETSAQVDFIEQVMHLTARQELLDVPCGEGRVALELARRGHHVTGVDLSEPLIEQARVHSTAERLEVRWERGDMRRLRWQGAFDAHYPLTG